MQYATPLIICESELRTIGAYIGMEEGEGFMTGQLLKSTAKSVTLSCFLICDCLDSLKSPEL